MPFTATKLRAEAKDLFARAEIVRAAGREETTLEGRARRYEAADNLERMARITLRRAEKAEERASLYRLTRRPIGVRS